MRSSRESSPHLFAHFHLATVSSFAGAEIAVATRQGLEVLTNPISLVLPGASAMF